MLEIVYDSCSKCDCGAKRPIVNKRHYLCDSKNQERKTGKTIQEIQNEKRVKYQEKQRSKPKKPLKPKKLCQIKKSPVKKRSKKQSAIENRYHETLKEFDVNVDHFCTGCDQWQGGNVVLSHSHIIARSDCKSIGRIDLVSDPENLTFHCLDFSGNEGCHGKWEGGRKHELLDYEKNMKYIKHISEELYNRLSNKKIF